MIDSALSKGWPSGPEAFLSGHFFQVLKDLTETGNRS